MSNINLRLYADQFYGLYIPLINNYLSNSIEKELFISSFKSGIINFNDISTNNKIEISKNLFIDSIKINALEIKIPDEKEELFINIENLKGNALICEINEKTLNELIIKEKNDLKEQFINNIFNMIKNNNLAKNDFFGDIIFDSIGNKIISGLNINIKNFEFIIKFFNCQFIVKIEKIEFSLKDIICNINLHGIKLLFRDIENNIEENVIKNCDIQISINCKNSEINMTELKVNINNIQINLNMNMLHALFEIINVFQNIEQKKLELRNKKLIQFHKPKIKDKNYYKLLWLYAIKSVIKLRKYICFDNFNIFEISNFTQNKIINKGINEDLILINDLNLLKSTKQILEKKLIDSKDSIANKFFSFFSSKIDDSKSLTEDEKDKIDYYYKEENIIKYIRGELFNNKNKIYNNKIVEKYIKYLDYVESNVSINNIEITLMNKINIQDKNLHFDGVNIDLKYGNKIFDFYFSLVDKIMNNKILEISYNNSNEMNILIKKDNVEISDNILFLFICYSKIILQNIIKKRSFFHMNKIINKEDNLPIVIKKINFPFFPSISLKIKNDKKIDINISNYSMNEKLISFQIEIKDSINTILENYKFDINLANGCDINLEKPLTINIEQRILEELVTKFKNIYNEFYLEKKQELKIYNFNFNKNINNINLFNNDINIILKEFNFILNDKDNQSSILLNNINISYENKNLSFYTKDMFVEIDLLSLMPLINEIKNIKSDFSFDYQINYKLQLNKIVNSFKLNINTFKNYFYLSHKNSYIYTVINCINIENEKQNINILKNSINNIISKYEDNDIHDKIILDSKKINVDLRIISLKSFVAKMNIDSPLISIAILLYNYNGIQKLIKYFLKYKRIYEIRINNLKFEYLKENENSDLSLYITNYNKIKENNEIDILNLEKYDLSYNLDSYKDIITKVYSDKLNIIIAQRDISYIFSTLFSPSSTEDNIEENIISELNSLSLDINLNNIKIDFFLRDEYENTFFDLTFGKMLLKLDISGKSIKYLNSSLNQFQIKYYGNEDDNILSYDKKMPITIINYYFENEKEKYSNDNEIHQQIEIKKEIGNKYIININKINCLLQIDVLSSIIHYFKDLSIFDLILNYLDNKISKEEIKDIDIQLLISEIQISYPRKNNYLYFSLSKLDFNNIKEQKNNIIEQQFKFSLNLIEAKYLKRKILFSKNDFFLFVLNIKDDGNISMICNSLLNKLIMNLSYYDFICFYKIILDIYKLKEIIKIEKEREKEEKKGEEDNDKEYDIKFELSSDNLYTINKAENKLINNSRTKKFSIISEMNFEGIDITFLEEDYNFIELISNYKYLYPFFNINMSKSYLKFEYEKKKTEKYPNIIWNFGFDLSLNYLNYDYKVWEPLTEDLNIKIDYLNKNELNKIGDTYTLEINKCIFNLSDTFINILLIKMFRFYNKFKTSFITCNSGGQDLSEMIIKYKISNYTDVNLDINYRNRNYKIKKFDKILIDFNEDENEEINDNLNNYFIFKFENNNKKIIVFPENFGIYKHEINVENKEKDIYIEAKSKKHNHIDVNIFSSILIKNSTDYSFKINSVDLKEKSDIIELKSHSAISFTDELIKNNIFNLILNSSQDNQEDILNIKLEEIMSKNPKEKLSKEIFFKNKKRFFSLSCKKKMENLTFLNIQYKYCIINCLPCSLFITPVDINNKSNPGNEDIEIKKNSLYNIDDISLLTKSNSIKLKIKVQEQYYISKLSLMRNDTKTKLLNFVSPSNDKTLNLEIIIKESYKNKAMIIYSENILNNKSGLELNIFTQDENNNNYIYDIGNNLYIISSEIKKSNSFICIKSSKNIFLPKYLNYEDIQKKTTSEFTLSFEGKKDVYNFDLILDKKVSDLWCENDINNLIRKINKKEINISVIYTIMPKYNIINLSSYAINKSINLILKSSKNYLMGINIKNMEDIRDKNNYYVFDNLGLNSFYTICFKENMYNIEIKKAEKNGYKNIFINNYNSKNSQIIIENKTNFEIFIKQKTFEKFKQKINKNDKQILKIYDQSNKNFSVEIDNKLYFFNLNESEERLLKKNLFLYIEKDKVVKKIILFTKNSNEDKLPKSKSLMNLNQLNDNDLIYNFNRNKHIKINIIINQINVSIISQNNKNFNKNIERKEIALIFINDFQCGIKLLTSKNNSKYKMKLNIKIASINAYNLSNNATNCLCMNTSSPLINIYSELTYELEKNKLSIFELVNEISNIKLNLTPSFLQEIYNFVINIYENEEIFTKEIHEIFLIKNPDNLNIYNFKNISDSNINFPFSITINKITLSGIKIRFKLKKEGLELLPKAILDSINYFKCFPFFDIGKETKAIISKIELLGPFKDMNILFDEIKSNIITQLSTEIVIKVLHPSNNDIKENMKNMIGYDSSKSNHKLNSEISSRIKYKRIFLGKRKFFKKFDKSLSKVIHKINNLEEYNHIYYIDSIHNFNNDKSVIIFFENYFLYGNDNGLNINIIKYENIKKIKNEKINKKFYVSFKYIENENNKSNSNNNNKNEQEIMIEFKNEFLSQKIYKLLYNFSNI